VYFIDTGLHFVRHIVTFKDVYCPLDAASIGNEHVCILKNVGDVIL